MSPLQANLLFTMVFPLMIDDAKAEKQTAIELKVMMLVDPLVAYIVEISIDKKRITRVPIGKLETSHSNFTHR